MLLRQGAVLLAVVSKLDVDTVASRTAAAAAAAKADGKSSILQRKSLSSSINSASESLLREYRTVRPSRTHIFSVHGIGLWEKMAWKLRLFPCHTVLGRLQRKVQ
jgi:hypothetical protein